MLLFLTHIPVRLYFIKSGTLTLGSISLIESYAVRNTWLDAIPFLLIGISIRKNKENIRASHPIIISIFAIIVGIGEYFYNSKMIEPQLTHDVLYFGIIISVIIAFVWAIDNNGENSWIAQIGCKYSMMIYFMHPIVGWILQGVIGGKTTGLNIVIQCIFSIAVMATTTLIAVVIDRIKRRVMVKG